MSKSERLLSTAAAITMVALPLWAEGHAPSGLPVEVIAEFTEIRPANLTVTPQGRLIASMHPLDNAPIRIVEVTRSGKHIPFPTLDWADGPETGLVGFSQNVAVDTDSSGIWWTLDMGRELQGPQLVAWDTANNALHARIPLPNDSYLPTSFLQDMVIDETRNKAYIADMTFTLDPADAQPSIVVVDLETGAARRAMQGDKSFMPEQDEIEIDGQIVAAGGPDGEAIPLILGLNPITIDPMDEWVYYGGVNGKNVWRIKAADLASDVSDEDMSAKVEWYGPKAASDGIKVDGNGNVYISDIENHAIGVTTPGEYTIVAQDDVLLNWIDGMAIGPDGAVYGTQNNLHKNPALNAGKDESVGPYRIVRIHP